MPPTLLVVGEVADGHLTKLSAEIATLAAALAESSGGTALGLIVDGAPGDAATELAAHLPRVISVTSAAAADEAWAPHAAAEARRLADEGVTHVLAGVTNDGRDVAGLLCGALGWGMLANASGVAWEDGQLVVEAMVLAGKAITRSTVDAPTAIVTVRPGATDPGALATPGAVEEREPVGAPLVPAARVLDRVAEAGAEASLEEAKVVVVGGRGVGGPEGFALVDELAGLLGGVTGASRAAVDAGWIPYARQIGQTGKVVRPALYLSLGVSGAMQHRAGMQGSQTVVAINRDPDAPVAEIADLFVVADLFEVGPALAAEIRARRGG
ncbi:MAG TPA: electron transfer flavoprotein subunit alpha/FixB family protein [Candidatus Limnocylindrales bacterium]